MPATAAKKKAAKKPASKLEVVADPPSGTPIFDALYVESPVDLSGSWEPSEFVWPA